MTTTTTCWCHRRINLIARLTWCRLPERLDPFRLVHTAAIRSLMGWFAKDDDPAGKRCARAWPTR
ncbi:MAG: hypothetical protein M3548_09910 [Actinomycetota bacterium]|nr:hypothetical protein [Actinomycetota bacterium]